MVHIVIDANLGVKTPARRHFTIHLASWRSLCKVSFWSNSFTLYFLGTRSFTIVGRPRNIVAKTLPSAPCPISCICVSLTSRRVMLIFMFIVDHKINTIMSFKSKSWHGQQHEKLFLPIRQRCNQCHVERTRNLGELPVYITGKLTQNVYGQGNEDVVWVWDGEGVNPRSKVHGVWGPNPLDYLGYIGD